MHCAARSVPSLSRDDWRLMLLRATRVHLDPSDQLEHADPVLRTVVRMKSW
jgi:hypothetical protein